MVERILKAAAAAITSLALLGCAGSSSSTSTFAALAGGANSEQCLPIEARQATTYCRVIAARSSDAQQRLYEQDYLTAESTYRQAIQCFNEALNLPESFNANSCPNVDGYKIRSLTQLKADLALARNGMRQSILARRDIDNLTDGYTENGSVNVVGVNSSSSQEINSRINLEERLQDWKSLLLVNNKCSELVPLLSQDILLKYSRDDIALLQMSDLHNLMPSLDFSGTRIGKGIARELHENICRQQELENNLYNVYASQNTDGVSDGERPTRIRVDRAILRESMGRMHWNHAWSVVLAAAATSRNDLELDVQREANREFNYSNEIAELRQTRLALINQAITSSQDAINILLNQGAEASSLIEPRLRIHLAGLRLTRAGLVLNPIEASASLSISLPSGVQATPAQASQDITRALSASCDAYENYQEAVTQGRSGLENVLSESDSGGSRETARMLRMLGAVQSAAINFSHAGRVSLQQVRICGSAVAEGATGGVNALREAALTNYVAAIDEYKRLGGVSLSYGSVWPFFRMLVQRPISETAPGQSPEQGREPTHTEMEAAFVAAQFVRGSSAAQRVGVQAMIERAVREYAQGLDAQFPEQTVRDDFTNYFRAQERRQLAGLGATASSQRNSLGGGSQRLAEAVERFRVARDAMSKYDDFEGKILRSYATLIDVSNSIRQLEQASSSGGGDNSGKHAFVMVLAEQPQGIVFVIEASSQNTEGDSKYSFALTRPIEAKIYTEIVESPESCSRNIVANNYFVSSDVGMQVNEDRYGVNSNYMEDYINVFTKYWYDQNLFSGSNIKISHPIGLMNKIYVDIFKNNDEIFQSEREFGNRIFNSNVESILKNIAYINLYTSEKLINIPFEMLLVDENEFNSCESNNFTWLGDRFIISHSISTRNFVDKVDRESADQRDMERAIVLSGFYPDTDIRDQINEEFEKAFIPCESYDGDLFDCLLDRSEQPIRDRLSERYITPEFVQDPRSRSIKNCDGIYKAIAQISSIDFSDSDNEYVNLSRREYISGNTSINSEKFPGINGQNVQRALGISDDHYYRPASTFESDSITTNQSPRPFDWDALRELNQGADGKQGTDGSSLSNYEIVHFNTHGFIPPELTCFREASLLINGAHRAQATDEEKDWPEWARGFPMVPASELAKLNLRNTDLVTLAACESAQGQSSNTSGDAAQLSAGDISADSLTGLVVAFDQAGARNVIATRWSVAEQATSALMEAMYATLEVPGVSYTEALAAAQMSMRHDGQGAVKHREAPNNTRPLMLQALTAADSTLNTRVRQEALAREECLSRNNNDSNRCLYPWWEEMTNAYYWGAFLLIGSGAEVLDTPAD